jgi:hypothetical protein
MASAMLHVCTLLETWQAGCMMHSLEVRRQLACLVSTRTCAPVCNQLIIIMYSIEVSADQLLLLRSSRFNIMERKSVNSRRK